ncbi:hypothetical protein BGP_2017 [Beggiatoa sp. PS]|nr:hypothetical protein BGP_2017 [Beggiatoa sp. PS]
MISKAKALDSKTLAWSSKRQLWILEFKALALDFGVQSFSFVLWIPKL